MARSKTARRIARRYGRGSLLTQNVPMKTNEYLSQPSTWLGIAKLGAALGLYSTGVGGAIGTVIMGIFGLVDIFRNEHTK